MAEPVTPVTVEALLSRITGADNAARAAAILQAGTQGARAVAPLAGALVHPERNVARAASAALERVALHAGRPGAAGEARAVSTELVRLLPPEQPRPVRLAAIRALALVGGAEAAPPLARLLGDPDLREEARQALEKIPDRAAERELRQALRTVPEAFRPALEQSLRKRRARPAELGVAPAPE